MAIPYTTDYTDYDKYNELADLIKQDKDRLDQIHFEDFRVQGDDNTVELTDRFYRLNMKLNRTKHAIDSLNFVLHKFGDHFTDFTIGEASDDEGLKDMIDSVELASFYLDVNDALDYKLKDLDHLLGSMEDQYIHVEAYLALPTYQSALHTDHRYLTVAVFVKNALLSDGNYLK